MNEKDELKELEKIIFIYKRINKINVNAFKALDKLKRLHLNSNKITDIDLKAFESLSNLNMLYLSKNKLKRIDSDVFKGLHKLERLYLYENEITDIDAKAFEPLSKLKSLVLNNNRLKRIDSNVFKGLHKLERLFLNNNEITDIDVKAFESLSSLQLLELGKNKLRELDRKCLEPLKSIYMIGLYANDDLKALSFYIPEADIEPYLFEKLKLKKSEFLCNWGEFLKQLPISLEEEIGNLNSLLKLSEFYYNKVNTKYIFKNFKESLMSTIRIRRVKSEKISSLWITIDLNRKDLIGELIDKKYKIESYLGEGGFGKVYTVMDLNDNNM